MSADNTVIKSLECAVLAENLPQISRLSYMQKNDSLDHYNILRNAIFFGKLKAAKMLISHGCRLAASHSSEDNEILHLAIATEDLELVQLLIKRNISTKQVDKDGKPPIFKLVHISLTEFHYSKFIDSLKSNETNSIINSKHQPRQFTLLHYAAEVGNAEIIPVILNRHGQLNPRSSDGSTPLHIAVQNRHQNVVKTLLYHRAKDYLVNNKGINPMRIAVLNGDVQMIQILLNHISRTLASKRNCFQREVNRPLVYLATSIGNREIVNLLLINEAPVDYSTETGQTALHLAIEKGDLEIILLLLKYRASFKKIDAQGFSPFHVACMKGNFKVVSLLLHTNECNLAAQTFEGFTALHLAVRAGHPKIVALLLSYGADYTEVDQQNRTPLALALENTSGDEETLIILLEHIRRTENVESNIFLFPEDCLFIKYHTEAIIARNNSDNGINENSNCSDNDANNCNDNGSSNYNAGNYNAGNYNAGNYNTSNYNTSNYNTSNYNASNYNASNYNAINIYNANCNDNGSNNGNSVLHLAVEKEDLLAVELFLKHCACVHLVNNQGYTPFDLATIKGSFPIISIFLQYFPDPKVFFTRPITPMHLAVQHGNIEMMELFFRVGISTQSPGFTPLHVAIRKGDKNLVLLLLSKGASVNVPGRSDFETPLFVAAQMGNPEVLEIVQAEAKDGYLALCVAAYFGHERAVRMLLDKGIDANENTEGFLTPLHAAAQQGHEAIVRLLVQRGAMINPGKRFVSTPLLAAAYSRHTAIVQMLLAHGANFNAQIQKRNSLESYPEMTKILKQGNYQDSEVGSEGTLDGYRALHFAVLRGDKAAVGSLIKFGAGVNSQARDGTTVFALAIKNQDEEIVRLLLSAGVDVWKLMKHLDFEVLKANAILGEIVVNHVSNSTAPANNVTPLGIAVENQLEACVEKLLREGASVHVEHNEEFVLLIAVRLKNRTIVRSLLQHRANVNCRGKNGQLAITLAVKNNDEHLVQLLLDAGAKVDVFAALDLAISNNNVPIVEIFLKKGITAYRHNSAFRNALRRGNLEVVQKFLNYGVSTDSEESKGECPIFYAIEGNNLEVVELFLKKGLYLNATTRKGETLIHCAISEDRYSVSQILVDYGVDLNAQNQEKLSPLERILKQGDYCQWNDLLKILLMNDVDPNQLDATGKTMLQIAIERESVIHVTLLLQNGADVNFLNANNVTALQVATDVFLKNSGVCLKDVNSSDVNDLHKDMRRLKLAEYLSRQLALKTAVGMHSIVRLLLQEVVRREVAKERINEENKLLVSSPYFKNYVEMCRNEIEVMKGTEICKGIRYFDVMAAGIESLAHYAIHGDVIKVLLHSEKISVRKMFPEYAETLLNRIEIGRDRRNLLDASYTLLRESLRVNFPFLIIVHIASFLTNRNLKSLQIAKDLSRG